MVALGRQWRKARISGNYCGGDVGDFIDMTNAVMRIFAGTSGYSYKEWKGSFYPREAVGEEDAELLRREALDG